MHRQAEHHTHKNKTYCQKHAHSPNPNPVFSLSDSRLQLETLAAPVRKASPSGCSGASFLFQPDQLVKYEVSNFSFPLLRQKRKQIGKLQEAAESDVSQKGKTAMMTEENPRRCGLGRSLRTRRASVSQQVKGC